MEGGVSRSSTLNRRTLSQNVQKLQDTLHLLFTAQHRAEFISALNAYHKTRDVQRFVESLTYLLDSPVKRHMIPLLRDVIPRNDVTLFDDLVEDILPDELRRPNKESVVVKRIRLRTGAGLGFSIRGGAEHGIGIYVSSVDQGGVAEVEGLAVGDQLVSVNDISFLKITHDEAVRILKSAKQLDLVVKSVGRIPGSYVVHQTYTWVDPEGYPVPPPPEIDRTGRYESKGERKSGLMLLKDRDERKVNVVVEEGDSLGLMIRGGNEFGLGIYVTGVDPYSVAENAGLKIGDQILDVNGQSFLDISHGDAVRVLKASPHMMMTIKDVGKLPYARTTYDQTHWIVGLPTDQSQHPHYSHYNQNGDSSQDSRRESVFSRGHGSQLMYASEGQTSQQWAMIMDQARKFLNDEERTTLTYYLSEYQDEHVTLDALMLALFDLLNTQVKFSMLTDIRTIIAPRDIDQFDSMVLKKEVDSMKNHKLPVYRPAKERGKLSQEELTDAIEQIDDVRKNGGPKERSREPLEKPRPRLRRTPEHAVPDHVTQPRDHVTPPRNHVQADVHNDRHSKPLHSPDSGVDLPPSHVGGKDPPPNYNSVKEQPQPQAVQKTTNKIQKSEPTVSPPAKSVEGDLEAVLVSVDKSEPTLGVAIEGGANTRQPLPRIINIQKVRIKKIKPVIGIAIVGGADTLEPLPKIIEIKPGGSAHASGGLKVGHVILEVDGQPLKGLEHRDVAQLIARAFKKKDKNYMELLVAESSPKLAK